MEFVIAGTVLGVAGLAGLFSTCVEVIQDFSSATSFGTELGVLQVKMEVEKVRLLIWGQSLGIGDGDAVVDQALEREFVQSAAASLLVCFVKIFEDSENLRKKYGLIQTTEPQAGTTLVDLDQSLLGSTFKRTYDKFKHDPARRQKETSIKTKARWAIVDEKRFRDLIEEMKGINDSLNQLVPGVKERSRVQMRTEIMRSNNEQQLQSLVNSSDDVNDLVSETASLRLEMLSSRGTKLRTTATNIRASTPAPISSPQTQQSTGQQLVSPSPIPMKQTPKAPQALTPYNNDGALTIHKVFTKMNSPSFFSWLVGFETPPESSPATTPVAKSAMDLIYVPRSLLHTSSKLMEMDPESDPQYPGWAPGSVSLSGFGRELQCREFEASKVVGKSWIRASPTKSVSSDTIFARWKEIYDDNGGCGKGWTKKIGYEQVRALVGPSEFTWLDPNEGLKFRHQISDLLAALSRDRVFPSFFEQSSIGDQLLRDQVDRSSDYHIIDFLYQILHAKEISLRLEKDQVRWHGGITHKVIYDMIAAELWLQGMQIHPSTQSGQSFTCRPETRKQQIEGMISFAEKMKWPYLDEAREFLQTLTDTTAVVSGLGIRLWDWIMGLVLPGMAFAVTLMYGLQQSCKSTKERLTGSVWVRETNYGFILPQVSYWRSRSVLGRVLAPLVGVHNVGGWVGPCPGISGPTIKTSALVKLKTRASSVKLLEDAVDDELYQLRAPHSNATWEEPELPPASKETCELQAVRLADLPADISVGPSVRVPVQIYHAKLDFQLLEAKTTATISLYANSIFIAALPCQGTHRINPKVKHLYRRRVLEVSDLPKAELSVEEITVINATAEGGEVFARAWCAQKGTNAVVWKKEKGCCFKCGLMMAGKEGLDINVLIIY